MPELSCTVQTCVHNKQFLCNLDKIEVGGSQARTARETCCDSFQERKADSQSNSMSGSYSNSMSGSYGNSMSASYSNVTGQATPLSNIDCKATECMYNCNCECHAGKISVEGSNACKCEGTECATFNCKG